MQTERSVGYFSMEIALAAGLPTAKPEGWPVQIRA